MKLWGGRFANSTNSLFEDFGASIHFDHVLWQDDIIGSLAHLNGLYAAGVLTNDDQQSLSAGLYAIADKIKNGAVTFNLHDEDIHMNIERLLHLEVGELAGKLHTGRSRNDQVALDMRLFMRREQLQLYTGLSVLQETLLSKANEYRELIFPGYTHLQLAQPIRFAHHFLAYFWMFARDGVRVKNNFLSTNCFPLGAGALAGNSFGINQHQLAEDLAFTTCYQNSIDAVSDRDYLVEFLANGSLIMMHLSKLCEEFILWSSQEFGFIELDDAYCTGSSMMPQKKNPDAAELIRGKTGRVYGALMALLTTLKALPLAYNKDLQEDKEAVFDTCKTLLNCLAIMTNMIASMKINTTAIDQSLTKGFLSATELANYLVKKGLPFRQAHEIIGKLVMKVIANKETLTLTSLQEASELFDHDAGLLLTLENVVEHYNNQSGTAKTSLSQQFNAASISANENKQWLEAALAQLSTSIKLKNLD